MIAYFYSIGTFRSRSETGLGLKTDFSLILKNDLIFKPVLFNTSHFAHHAFIKKLSNKRLGDIDVVRSAAFHRSVKSKTAPAENRTRGPTMATSDFTTKPLVLPDNACFIKI
jgi:hypothetical protein